jgi:hypothetical protein
MNAKSRAFRLRGFHTPAPPWDICASMKGGRGAFGLAFDFGQVSHARTDRADAVQQV